ncbi:uncharacterized protein LOC144747730 [Ciona intestinalis]
MTIHSSTRKQNLTLNYKVCLNWKPYYIKVTANPKDTLRVEKFNVTVVKINFYNAVLELERIDQDSGWEDMLFTVQWMMYHISDYITSTATVQYRMDYDTDLNISGTSNVSAVYGQGLSPLPALQNNPQFQTRLSHERQNGHSVQWNVDGGVDASSAWCNGKLLERFQARTSSSETKFVIGSTKLNGGSILHGAIGEFVLFKDVITDDVMKKYHLHFIEKWGITT